MLVIVGAGFTTDSGTAAALFNGSGSAVDELAVAITDTFAGAGFGNGQARSAVKDSAAISPMAIVGLEQDSVVGEAAAVVHVHPAGTAPTEVIVIPAGSG